MVTKIIAVGNGLLGCIFTSINVTSDQPGFWLVLANCLRAMVEYNSRHPKRRDNEKQENYRLGVDKDLHY